MSIRALALDLYKARQRVEGLQAEYDKAEPGDRPALLQQLNSAKQELQLLRRMLDGEKESGSFRKRFGGFGK